jgi:predicted DsbA family dithiol-disulfide isomerase/riboflavin biosynthesis pyrimidine reductase
VLTVKVAHDFICPWCWVGLIHARRLQTEYGVQLDWAGYELWPESLDWPEATASNPIANKPSTPSRFEFFCQAEGISVPSIKKPRRMRTFNAHQAVEYAKTEGTHELLIDRLYQAYWLEGKEINAVPVILEIAKGIIKDLEKLQKAIETNAFDNKVIDFDDDAYASGVFNVPTFFIGDERYAEQPYSVLKRAVESQIDPPFYLDIEFKNPHLDRPYGFINMVSTIDGKIITGERDEPVTDLGSRIDHLLMHRLEAKADCVLVGANSVRASGNQWNPKTEWRAVVTGSGNVPWDSQFLSNGKPIIICPESATFEIPDHITVIRSPGMHIDWHYVMKAIKDLGIEVVNFLGGSEVNAQTLRAGVVDEIFMTLAPKIKLGKDVPTIADGEPLTRAEVQKFELVSHFEHNGELFLRYRKPN